MLFLLLLNINTASAEAFNFHKYGSMAYGSKGMTMMGSWMFKTYEQPNVSAGIETNASFGDFDSRSEIVLHGKACLQSNPFCFLGGFSHRATSNSAPFHSERMTNLDIGARVNFTIHPKVRASLWYIHLEPLNSTDILNGDVIRSEFYVNVAPKMHIILGFQGDYYALNENSEDKRDKIYQGFTGLHLQF